MTDQPQDDLREISPPIITGLLRVFDLIVIALAALLAYYIRHTTLDVPGSYILITIVVMLVIANVFQSVRLYEFQALSTNLFQSRKLFLTWSVVMLLLVAVGFMTKTAQLYSRTWVALWFTFGFVGLSLLRFGLKILLSRWQRQGRLVRKFAVVGAGLQGQNVVRYLTASRDPSLELIGVFDDRKTRVPTNIDGLPVRGNVDDLLSHVRNNRVDQIIVALPWSAEARLLQVLRKLKTVPTDVRLCPEGIAYRFPTHGFTHVNGLGMLNVFERPLSNWDRVVKGLEDRLLAALVLIFISPLMLAIGLLIKFDSPGPIFFRQHRYGFNNKIIDVYKFRTMHQGKAEEAAVPQAQRNDPRVTRLGAFLRRTSLDELPQFINVVRGEMSIVGPRPHAIAHNEQFATIVDEYLARHNVKPGITGWAQINGYRGEIRSNQDLEKRIQYDLYYIDNWSLFFDLRIMAMTVSRGFVHDNAY